jgi:hypothetical protein
LQPLVLLRREEQRQRLEQPFTTKLANLEGRIQIAQSKVSAQKWQLWSRVAGVAWVLAEGAMRLKGIGRRGRPRSAGVAVRGVATERGQQASAQASVDKLLSEKQALEQQHASQIADLNAKYDTQRLTLEPLELKPRKSDIEIDQVALVWLPWRVDLEGHEAPVYRAPSASSTNDVSRTTRSIEAATARTEESTPAHN